MKKLLLLATMGLFLVACGNCGTKNNATETATETTETKAECSNDCENCEGCGNTEAACDSVKCEGAACCDSTKVE